MHCIVCNLFKTTKRFCHFLYILNLIKYFKSRTMKITYNRRLEANYWQVFLNFQTYKLSYPSQAYFGVR